MSCSFSPLIGSNGPFIKSQVHLDVVRRRQAVPRIEQLHYLPLSQLLLEVLALVNHRDLTVPSVRET